MKYEIVGENMQYLHVLLNDGESIYSDSGKLISKSDNTVMTPRLAHGIIAAIERKAVGASALLTEFAAKGGDGHVSLAGVFPGKVFQVTLGEGESFIAEQYAFLAADTTVNYTVQTMSISAMMFGGTGIILQRFTGPGNVFIHVVGDIIQHEVTPDIAVELDPGHLAGFDPGLEYKVRLVDNVRTAMFGGIGLFLAKFTGSGRVISHSVSRHKLSAEMYLDGLQQQKK
jgi:uncharacterized protein (TIGR00266 family)